MAYILQVNLKKQFYCTNIVNEIETTDSIHSMWERILIVKFTHKALKFFGLLLEFLLLTMKSK